MASPPRASGDLAHGREAWLISYQLGRAAALAHELVELLVPLAESLRVHLPCACALRLILKYVVPEEARLSAG